MIESRISFYTLNDQFVQEETLDSLLSAINTSDSKYLTHIKFENENGLKLFINKLGKQSTTIKVATPTLSVIDCSLFNDSSKVCIADPSGIVFSFHKLNFKTEDINKQYESTIGIAGEIKMFPFAFYRGLYLFDECAVIVHFQYGISSKHSTITLIKQKVDTPTSSKFFKTTLKDLDDEFDRIWSNSQSFYNQVVHEIELAGFTYSRALKVYQDYMNCNDEERIEFIAQYAIDEYFKVTIDFLLPRVNDAEVLGLKTRIAEQVVEISNYQRSFEPDLFTQASKFYSEVVKVKRHGIKTIKSGKRLTIATKSSW